MTGLKFDGGKPDLTLIRYEAIEQVARVFEFGARKYGRDNFMGGMNWLRLSAAALRHIMQWVSGESKDSESGESHLAHACCCMLMLLTYEAKGLGTDDRYKEPKNESN